MRILALVPARGGSKRLPGKNIRMLGEKPLINWTLEVAKEVPEISEILVSTDDPEIALIAKVAGASIPWMRPKILATDEATSVDVALHALDCYESENGTVDALLLLQPTSPFRTRETVQRGIELFKAYGRIPVVGVSPSRDHPMWTFKEQDGYLVPFLEHHSIGGRSQDLQPAFIINGTFYIISPEELRSSRSFIGLRTIPLYISSLKEALDIDSQSDFDLASLFCIQDY